MTISLTPTADTDTAELAAATSRIVCSPVTSIEPIGGGRNSQVYRVSCGEASRYVVKRYFAPRADGRERLETEFSGLRFLWEHGIRQVPQPVAADRSRGLAVYAYVEGRRILTRDVTERDIDQAIRFLAALKALREHPDSRLIPPASEACFSVRAILDNFELRLSRLSGVRSGGEAYEALAEFLAREFVPARDRIARWCWDRLNGKESFDDELPQARRTLSPSDFGFHNGARLEDGSIVYLDFEYFGWDDPAKTLADFVLHPAMELPEPLGRRFAAGLFQLFGDDRHLPPRAEAVYPLFGLKWCLILLNEFVPGDLRRRGFSSGTTLNVCELHMEQLAKAKRMLHRILRDYEHFPYRA